MQELKSKQGRSGTVSLLGRYWPAHLGNPFHLLLRLLKSRDRAALYTLWLFVLTLLAIPVDFVMSRFESRRIATASERKKPIIFICGPARSGTTVMHQMLVANLPLSYFSNLTAVFPRAPITAYRLFRRWLKRPVDTGSFYGKTASMSGANDADPIWNRWVKPDDMMYRTKIDESGSKQMARFFRAFEESEKKPIVCKNNKLLAFAPEIDPYVENAWYICLSRDPVYLAQSQIIAAKTLLGDPAAGYGIGGRSAEDENCKDPISVAVNRVQYNQALIKRNLDQIGADRFWVINYEEFCANPQHTLVRVATEILKLDAEHVTATLPRLVNQNKIKLPDDEFSQLHKQLSELS